MTKFLLFLAAATVAFGCGSEPVPAEPKNDAGIQAASLGIQSSPTADLLKDMTKGQPGVDLSDPAKNERNARMLPELMKNENAAFAKIQSGVDPLKAADDLQKQNAAMGLGK